jgi:hypothetical protein
MATADATMSRAEFIRGFGMDMPAHDVVEAGRKKGIRFDEKYVYVIRSGMRRTKSRSTHPASSAPSPGRPERDFVATYARIGFERGDELIREVKTRLIG